MATDFLENERCTASSTIQQCSVVWCGMLTLLPCVHAQVTRYLQEEGLDATDEAVDQIFQCYDYDGTSTCRSVFILTFVPLSQCIPA